MTAPEVDWVLQKIKDNWDVVGTATVGSTTVGQDIEDVPLERIDRDNSKKLDGSVREHTDDLMDSNYVGASHVDKNTSPIGTEYDHDAEHIVSLRIEGLHESEFGHIDPDGNDGITWTLLVQKILMSFLIDRKHPQVGRDRTVYTDIRTTNDDDQASDYGDYYRYDVDLIFDGYEDLP